MDIVAVVMGEWVIVVEKLQMARRELEFVFHLIVACVALLSLCCSSWY